MFTDKKSDLIEASEANRNLLQYDDKCDKYDYMAAVACGAIGGVMDIFLVGMPGEGILGKWTDQQVDKAVMAFAKKMKWNPKDENENNVNSAIGFLERNFRVNYDQRRTVDVQLPEEKIYLCRKGEKYAETGDRLVIECVESEKEVGALGIYIKELYEEDPREETISNAVNNIVREIQQVQETGFLMSAQKLRTFEDAKPQIILRAINFNRNERDLKDAIYKKIGDIALAVYFRIGETKGGVISTKLRKSQIEKWNKNEEEVFQLAMENTSEMSEPRIYCWWKMISNLGNDGEGFMNRSDITAELNKGPLGNCMSTREKTNGATALFLPGVAERLAELLDGDFYAVFTSVHEVMIHAAETADVDDLKAVLKKTMADMTAEDEVLTEDVYRYDSTNGILVPCR